MIRDDLHPEELLARAAQGPLGTEEAADLKAHLARCPACALQLDLRADVGLALAPTDADFDVGARAVQRLLASGATVTRPARGGRRVGATLAARAALIALTLLGAGVGAAAVLYRVREGRFWGTAAPTQAVAAREKSRAPQVAAAEPSLAAVPAEAAAIVAPGADPAGAAVAAPEPQAEAIQPPPAASGANTAPPPLAVPPAARGAEAAPPSLAVAPAPRPRALRVREVPAEIPADLPEAPPPPVEVPRAPPAAQTDTAQHLFQAAERARRRGDSTEADRLYAQLASDFPRSREEIVARALRGQLLLDELGNAAEALASFDAYLSAAPRGALGEEARAGRAEAFGRLARRREEAAAWTELLASYPGSLYAPRARERLAALSRE